jgi:hypothetical protein
VGVLVDVFLSFFGERGKRKVGEGNLLLPLPRGSRGRRRPTVPFKMTSFRSFFFETVDETAPLYLKRVISFKRNGAKNVLESKSILNL